MNIINLHGVLSVIGNVPSSTATQETAMKMTPLGWTFMGIVWLVLTVLLIYCFWKILFEEKPKE